MPKGVYPGNVNNVKPGRDNPNYRHGRWADVEMRRLSWVYLDERRRCTDPRHKRYADYGGRGIEFRFRSFDEWYAELGPRPKGYTVDRKDNNGHYEPGNLRWATYRQQNNNRRRSGPIPVPRP